MKKKHKDFEIIWVSHDHTSDDFVRYFQQMPWLAMAADSVAFEGAKLSHHFGVNGIPTLVFLDVSHTNSEYSLLTISGVTKVSDDPYALQFHYKPRFSRIKSLVPKKVRGYFGQKAASSLGTVKASVNSFLANASPFNIVKFLIRTLRNGLFAILRLCFPGIVKRTDMEEL